MIIPLSKIITTNTEYYVIRNSNPSYVACIYLCIAKAMRMGYEKIRR